MSRYALMLTVAVALTASGAALSGEIYKWTDEDGSVHYVDRPTGDPTEERINIQSHSTNNANVQASIDARRERTAAREEARTKRQEAAADQAKAEHEAADRQKKCTQYRARLESFLASQRLYREDDSGDRVYLDDDEILQARTRVEDQIQEFCD